MLMRGSYDVAPAGRIHRSSQAIRLALTETHPPVDPAPLACRKIALPRPATVGATLYRMNAAYRYDVA